MRIRPFFSEAVPSSAVPQNKRNRGFELTNPPKSNLVLLFPRLYMAEATSSQRISGILMAHACCGPGQRGVRHWSKPRRKGRVLGSIPTAPTISPVESLAFTRQESLIS